MSWETIYPVLDEGLLAQYHGEASTDEKAAMAEMFAVAEVINRRQTGKVVSASLFYKPMNPAGTRFPPLSEEVLRNAKELGLVERFSPWKHYVEPLFAGARRLAQVRPEVVFRVYLAKDLAFLIPKLVKAGCEVFLMKSSSIGMQPGMMWRFPALEEKEAEVSIVDSDRGRYAAEDADRTALMRGSGLRYWRLWNPWHDTPYSYPAFVGSQVGGIGGKLPVAELAEAFVWHRLKGRLGTVRNPVTGEDVDVPDRKAEWPCYGTDEWFLTVALFSRMAREGILTLTGAEVRLNHWHALDIEYCLRQNPESQIVLVDHADPIKRIRRKDGG